MHHTTSNSDLKYGLSGLATAPIGYLVLLFLPVYLEVVGISLALTEQQIGWLASTDSIGLVIANCWGCHYRTWQFNFSLSN